MTQRLALQLHRSAKDAVLKQFPTLEYWKIDRMTEAELRHRHGEEMTLDIIDEVEEYYDTLSEETYPRGGYNNQM